MTDNQKYELVERDGETMRHYPASGRLMVQTPEGRWVFTKGTKKDMFTSETGKGAALSRWEQIQEAAMKGLMKATKTELPGDAVEALSERFADLAMSGERGRAPYAGHVIKLAGLVSPGEVVTPHEGGFKLSLEGSLAEFRKSIAKEYAYVEAEKPSEVVEGEVVEHPPEEDPHSVIVNLDGLPNRPG